MEHQAIPSISINDFQKTSDTDNFGASLLSLDFSFESESRKAKSVETLLNLDLPLPPRPEKQPLLPPRNKSVFFLNLFQRCLCISSHCFFRLLIF
jgi:hypothetical protein